MGFQTLLTGMRFRKKSDATSVLRVLAANFARTASAASVKEKGVCGIDPDAMAMRTLLLHNIMGAGTYSHHAYEAYRTLRETALGKTCFQMKDPAKLKWMCGMVGISTNQSDSMLAEQLADLLDQEMAKGPGEPGVMVEAFAPKKRKEVWKKLNIYPSGVIHEEQNCVASCLTNVDDDRSLTEKPSASLRI